MNVKSSKFAQVLTAACMDAICQSTCTRMTLQPQTRGQHHNNVFWSNLKIEQLAEIKQIIGMLFWFYDASLICNNNYTCTFDFDTAGKIICCGIIHTKVNAKVLDMLTPTESHCEVLYIIIGCVKWNHFVLWFCLWNFELGITKPSFLVELFVNFVSQ